MRKNLLLSGKKFIASKSQYLPNGSGGLGQQGFYGFNFSSPLLGPQ
jgi:hypothetical protein